ncbi:MAG: DUF4173 domain-containing protein [Bacteroidota bacterium]
MKKEIFSHLAVLLSTILFFLFFWKEQMGLNVLLFTAFQLACLFFLFPEKRESRPALLLSVGTLLAAIMVVWHNSFISKLSFNFSFLALIGAFQARGIRFFFYMGLMGVLSFVEVPVKFMRQLTEGLSIRQKARNFFYGLRIVLLPLVILIVFYQIYITANDKFAVLAESFWARFNFISLSELRIEKLIFFIFGFFVAAASLWRSQWQLLSKLDGAHQEQLVRKKTKSLVSLQRIFPSPVALKTEYRMSVFLLLSLNVLLLLVNLTDITYVWFSFEGHSPQALSSYVHEGTYLLIWAILLAMGILLFNFRKNLNFYPNAGQLRKLAYLWIGQNALLSFSVLMRNYHYIDHYGLAYKRVGVLVFLSLVLFGLATLYLKISQQKTLYFLLHRNAWAVYLCFLLLSGVNWDVFITRYNLEADTKGQIDTWFLTNDMADKNLFLLHQHKDLLLRHDNFKYAPFAERLDKKTEKFRRRTEQLSWLSWNYSDYRNQRYLLQKD